MTSETTCKNTSGGSETDKIPPKIEESENDEVPQLSAHTLAALQQFYSEQEDLRELLESATLNEGQDGDASQSNEAKATLFQNDLNKNIPEDWQLSQFWYDEETSKTLANEVLKQSASGQVACLSCPSIFRACESAENVHLFEFDKRFQAFGSSYHFYDYNDPENILDSCISAYSVVIADPPFPSEECLEKVALTVKKLIKENGKIILCTGAVMEPIAERVLNLKRSSFVPTHANNLVGTYVYKMSGDMRVCDLDPDLKKMLTDFRFQKNNSGNSAIIMKVDRENHRIILDEAIDDLESISDLVEEHLPSHQPRFLVLSCKVTHSTTNRVSFPLCFIFISPRDANPELQMMYAGSKLSLQKELNITKVFEIRELEEFTEEWLMSKLDK